MNRILSLCGCAALISLVACSAVPPREIAAAPPPETTAPASGTAAAPPESLAGTGWLAEDIEGAGVVERSQSTIEFLADGRVAGNLGCNRYTGSYSADASGLRFAQIAATRRACAPALMDQEAKFNAVLLATRGLRFEANGALWLLDANGLGRARLVRTAGNG